MLVDFIKELFAGLSKKGRLESLNEAIDFSEKSQDYIEMMHYCNRVLQLDPCNHVAIEKILNYSSKIEDPQEELFLLDEVVSKYVLEPSTGSAPLMKKGLYKLAIAHARCNEHVKANEYLKKLIEIDPHNKDANFFIALNYMNLNQKQLANRFLDATLEIDPDFMDAHIQKIIILESLNELEDAQNHLNYAKKHKEHRPEFLLYKAKIEFRKKQFKLAQQTLKKIPVEQLVMEERIVFYNLLGQVQDRLKNYNAAYRNFLKSNEFFKSLPEYRLIDPQQPLKNIQACMDEFATSWLSRCKSKAPFVKNPPVFFIGFPRSGTTLLGRMLNSHSKIHLIEEKVSLEKFIADTLPKEKQYPRNLAELTENQIRNLQILYMEEIKKHVGNEADLVHKLLIDKVPMNTVHLGLIYRLFPEAKVIFSLRNCADVVLSCFMQKFGLNNTMANFLDLKSTANLYNKTMELFELYQNTLQLQIISVRYENLIVDTEYELKVLFDFLELPWEEGVLNYRQNSFGAEINTPSYAAVSEKLYSSSRERWKNYEKQLQPVLPIIQPWLEKFGYSEESS